MKNSKRTDVQQVVTDQLIKMIEEGTVFADNWIKNANVWDAKSAITGEYFKGVNRFILGIAMLCNQYKSSVWMTYKQANDAGYQVKSKSKGITCIFYSTYEKKGDEAKQGEDKELIPFIKRFTLFNADQVEGYPVTEIEKNLVNFEENELAQKIIGNAAKEIKFTYGAGACCYLPSQDTICLPDREAFTSENTFYATCFHEIVHGTGNSKRLNRSLGGQYGSKEYAFEELIAELGAAYLTSEIGALNETIEGHAAYLQNWLGLLKSDKKAIFKAAAQAQKASDFVLEKWAA